MLRFVRRFFAIQVGVDPNAAGPLHRTRMAADFKRGLSGRVASGRPLASASGILENAQLLRFRPWRDPDDDDHDDDDDDDDP